MLPDSALKFARYLKQDNILDKQLQESWQSTWTAQDITVDSKDRYTVRVLGRQEVHRLDNGVTLDEARQLSLSLKLIADPKGPRVRGQARGSGVRRAICNSPPDWFGRRIAYCTPDP